MPPDKWQMIIHPDTTETTHLSYRYTQHKHTVDVSVYVYVPAHVCLLQSCSQYLQLSAVATFGGGCAVCILSWTHVICDGICTW